MKRVKVVRERYVQMQPRAECFGTNAWETMGDCSWNCPVGPTTKDEVAAHIKANPTHQVATIQENRSLWIGEVAE